MWEWNQSEILWKFPFVCWHYIYSTVQYTMHLFLLAAFCGTFVGTCITWQGWYITRLSSELICLGKSFELPSLLLNWHFSLHKFLSGNDISEPNSFSVRIFGGDGGRGMVVVVIVVMVGCDGGLWWWVMMVGGGGLWWRVVVVCKPDTEIMVLPGSQAARNYSSL